MDADTDVVEPFILHYVAGRYLIFDTHVLRHLRETHHICGVLIGTLPQISQQNIFLGLPAEIMTEEAAYLVRQRYAYVLNDTSVHRDSVAHIGNDALLAYKTQRDAARVQRETLFRDAQVEKRRAALEKRGLTHILPHELPPPLPSSAVGYSGHVDTVSPALIYQPPSYTENTEMMRSSAAAEESHSMDPQPMEARYNLYKYLHDKAYFMTPGLRFGAQYVAYPGDPLRFHSHFVASGHDWASEFPIMDIVAGGRLGTGVKKAWLVGAQQPDTEEMRCFTVEWAGM